MSVQITKADLEALPGYPQTVHVPRDRLVVDPADLPEQRIDANGNPVCWCCPQPLHGNAVLCTTCRKNRANQARQDRRDSGRPDLPVSKTVLGTIHDADDSLGPMVNDLTVAYNDERALCFKAEPSCVVSEQVHLLMLRVKEVERTVGTLLPDPRPEHP